MISNNIIKPSSGYLDNILSVLFSQTLLFWKKLQVTPNILTTIGLVFTILFNYFLYKEKYLYAIVCLSMRLYFDYIDGLFARKYNMVSKFGGYYDHIVDIFFFAIPVLYIFYIKNPKILYIIIPIFIISGISIGCVEKEYHNQTKKGCESLGLAVKLCPSNLKLKKIIKNIDCTFMYIVLLIIILYQKSTNNI